MVITRDHPAVIDQIFVENRDLFSYTTCMRRRR